MAESKRDANDEPRYTQAQRDDIDNFLSSLGAKGAGDAMAKRGPSTVSPVAEVEPPRRAGSTISVERVPDGPPLDGALLQDYLVGLRSKVYRVAAGMGAPEPRGNQTAAVHLRVRSDGGVQSLQVLDVADRQEDVEFTLRVLERAAPYARFPAPLAASIRSVGIVFCIRPEQEETALSGRFGC